MMKFFTTLTCILLFATTSQAQVFPYLETFDSYTVNQPLNGLGGISASSHLYVGATGVVGNCGEFRMTDTAAFKIDTLTSPLIGRLTAHTVTSFYFRVVTMNGGVASRYQMQYNDQVQIYVGIYNFNIALPQYTIDSTDQNSTAAYVKVVVPAPSQVNTYSGQFRVIAYNPDGHNWFLQFDSLVVKDTLPVSPVLLDSITNVKCRAQSTGGIKVIASVATPPYTYLWSTGDTTDAISGQPAGAYTVTVTDHLGVSASLTDTIRQPALALILDSLTKTPALCYGSNTGTAEIYASGGTGGYTYAWSTNPQTHSQQATSLTSGNYTVTVSDANSCTVTASVHITQPSNALLTTTNTTQSTLGNNGTATVTATGGTGTVHYAWSTNPIQTSNIATGLAPGLYEVTVSDGSGCVIVDTVFVAFPAGIDALDGHSISIYPNPATDRLYIDVKGINDPKLSITVMDLNGRIVNVPELSTEVINTSSIANGVYIIKLTLNGDSYMRKINILR